jgi:transcriptional repressor NrdR
MRCPRCGHIDDRVVDSRQTREGDLIRRRRECLACQHRFTTYERTELALPAILKKDGRRQPFERSKVERALKTACRKRDIRDETLSAVVDRIEWDLAVRGEKEVPSGVVGSLLLEELRHLDGVAYVRFASVYRSYDSIDEFISEVARARMNPRSEGDE